MSIKKTVVKSLKPGSYFLIEEEPCVVVSIEKSKPGKHGSAKANITARGLFDNRKRNVIMPADRMVDVPVIDKRTATIIADMGESLSLMDSETYATYDIPRPTDEDIATKIELNAVVEVWDVMGRMKVVRVKKD
ncbi:MAG: translation initiation factor IF-5A [Candidatus Thorarchaeota archaeon]|nr:MAG: translation initiation factor IF-5A [Candidatus Thorarchaeota archaeon]